MKVLVTGATGFLGSHLCRHLAASGRRVAALRRPDSKTELVKDTDIEFRTGDLTDQKSLLRAVDGCDALIHAAADINYASKSPAGQNRTNIEGTRILAEICRQQCMGRFVHVSSVSAIGIPPNGIVADEQFPFNLESSGLNYHISKKRAEMAVFQEVSRGLDAVVVNPASIFGPYGDSFRGGEMISKVWQSRLVPYFVGGICAVHVSDVVAGIVSALDTGIAGERYILGGENLTYKELAQRSAGAFGLKPYFFPVGPLTTGVAAVLSSNWAKLSRKQSRFTYTTHYCASRLQFYSSLKAQRQLGYSFRPFSAILQEYIDFCR